MDSVLFNYQSLSQLNPSKVLTPVYSQDRAITGRLRLPAFASEFADKFLCQSVPGGRKEKN